MSYGMNKKTLEKLVNVSGVLYNSDMFKSYWYVCHSCDASIEIVSKGIHFQDPSCNCSNPSVVWCQTSVVESTTNQTKEEQMETTEKTLAELYDNSAKIIVKNTTSGVLVYDELSPYDINCLITDNHHYKERLTKLVSQINNITDNLTEEGWFNPNVEKSEVLSELCEILGITPTKTVRFIGTMTFEGSVEVPFDEFEDFDLESELSENLQVSSWSGNIDIESYDLDSVRED